MSRAIGTEQLSFELGAGPLWIEHMTAGGPCPGGLGEDRDRCDLDGSWGRGYCPSCGLRIMLNRDGSTPAHDLPGTVTPANPAGKVVGTYRKGAVRS